MSLACEIQPTGTFGIDSLRFKQIDFYDVDGNRVGWFCLGGPRGNCLFVDGVEVAIVQKDDPPQIRLATRDQNGVQMGGVIQGCVLRLGEDVFENLAQWQIGGKADDAPPGTLEGVVLLKVRTNQGPDEDGMQTAFVATRAYLGHIWAGLAAFPGDLSKYANAGDPGPYVCPGHGGGQPAPTPPAPGDTLWTVDGYVFAQLQGDTNFVIYRTAIPFDKNADPGAVFDTASTTARLADLERRIDKLERRPGRK